MDDRPASRSQRVSGVSANALHMNGTKASAETGSRPICRVPRRYACRIARRARATRSSGPSDSAAGESACSFLNGEPCHSCAMVAPPIAYRLTSPKPWVTTSTPAPAVASNPARAAASLSTPTMPVGPW